MSLFKEDDIVPEIQEERLFALCGQYLDVKKTSKKLIWRKYLAAEKDIARRLRVFFEPTEVLPPSITQAYKDSLDAASKPWIDDPGEDWDPQMFSGRKWGWFSVRHRPITNILSIKFIYPGVDNELFDVPPSWFRPDKKYGTIQLVPDQDSIEAPLSAFWMRVVGGGRVIPHMLHLHYEAGISDITNDYPDILDLVKRATVLRLLDDAFLAQTSSISADGISESVSIDLDKYRDAMDKSIKELKEEIHGIPSMVV